MAIRKLCALAFCLTLLALPADASAASLVGKPLQKAIWGPAEVEGQSQFPIYKELGVTLYQIQLRWEMVARRRPEDPTNPADPAYVWTKHVEYAVAEAASHGIPVMLLVQGAPKWSNQNLPWSTPADDPADYAAFITAAARKFPSVRHWMIWGEPLRNINWPGYDRTKPGRERIANAYTQILDMSYEVLKRESPRNIVIGGNSFTTDFEPQSWAPVPLFEWMRILRLPNGKPPRMDIWGHNPFTTRKPNLRNGPAKDHLGDLSDTKRVLRALKRHISKPMKRKVPLFLSEFCLPTGPNNLIPIELSQQEQAQWLRAAFKISRSLRDVWGLGWFKLRDDPPPPGTEIANRCGLIEADGKPKLSYETFKKASRRRRR